ncbi:MULTISPECIES: SPFH domain-containing protein [unclassified Luteococcus]|uniref:SPFH domain-containing protein n=1 Tax=unclassified Luteococcus TaxID=2639923 RepID=UPI00313DCAFE
MTTSNDPNSPQPQNPWGPPGGQPNQPWPPQGHPGQGQAGPGQPGAHPAAQPWPPQQPPHRAAGEPTSVGGSPAGRPVGAAGTRVSVQEKRAFSVPGLLALVLTLALLVFGAMLAAGSESGGGTFLGILLIAAGLLAGSSLTIVQPGQTKVIQFFGNYIGTLRKPGLQMTVPLTAKRTVSVKVNNFETHELKVNDADGNPVNIAAIIVWQVADTAKSVFAVENYMNFVAVQSESALRHVASVHPYDNADPGVETLRGSTDVIAGELAAEVAERIQIAGLEVLETRIASLAYAPEIAQAMLQRQQASAVLAAREKIVLGAVSMVQDALTKLEEQQIVTLDDDRRAQMVSNLLVILCSDSRATPVLNAGAMQQ